MFPTIDRRATGINLRRLMDERGLSLKEVQEYLHLGSVQSIYHWVNGISLPTVDNLYAMSELFQVPIDEILCGNRKMFAPEFDAEKAYFDRISVYCRKLNKGRAA